MASMTHPTILDTFRLPEIPLNQLLMNLSPFETSTEDGALGDLLAQIYAEVHRRSGIVKLHCGATERPHSNLTVYDYLRLAKK